MDFMLPFTVGDLVESRSFSPGYRGAWFTSKISLMCVRQGHLECLLEFIDFPDEKKTWTRLYKIRPYRKRQSSENRDIMIRPTFPQWYLENQLPEQHTKPNVMLVVTNPWKVGDLIEWRHTDCCWSGKIIELLGDDKVKIALHDPPIGEGGYYEADCKDLRPALDWSLEKGWSVPVSQENGECWFNARLIIQKTDTENSSSDEENEPSHDGGEEVRECLNVPSDVPVEVMETGTELPRNTNDKVLMYNQRDGKEEDLNCLNGTSNKPQEVENSDVNLPPNQNGGCCTQGETEHPSPEGGESLDAESSPLSLKRRKISTEPTLVDRSADIITTIDDNMIELEKVADRIRRLQNLLSVESDQSSVPKDSWKFLDKEASTKQK